MGRVSAWLGRAGVELTDVCAQEGVLSSLQPQWFPSTRYPPPAAAAAGALSSHFWEVRNKTGHFEY